MLFVDSPDPHVLKQRMRLSKFSDAADRLFKWVEGPPSEEEEYVPYFFRRGALNVALVGVMIPLVIVLIIAWIRS